MAGKRKQKGKLNSLIYIILAIIAAVVGISRTAFLKSDKNLKLEDGNIAVRFVDVGQGNCTVIQSGSEGILIDAGEREYSSKVLSFLEENGITKLRLAIATHPHSDHIGAMAAVLDKIDTDEIFLPDIADKYAPTSKTYLNLLSTVDERNIKADFLSKNKTVNFDGVKITVLTPVEQTNSYNNMSLITKIVFGDMSTLILADAENKEINSVMKANKNFDFSAHIIMLGHHGSNTSLNKKLMSLTNSSTAIISCGKDNSYGHPHKEVIDYLKTNGIEYYRTDEKGDISLITDGEKYNIITER